MTPDQTRKVVDMAYAQWPHVEPDGNLYTLWHFYLAEHPIETVSPALKALLRHATDYPPTIARLMDEIETPRARTTPIEHPEDCHCANVSHGRLFQSRAGLMTCPGPLGPEALDEYVMQRLAQAANERRQQPHIRALPPEEARTVLRLIRGDT